MPKCSLFFYLLNFFECRRGTVGLRRAGQRDSGNSLASDLGAWDVLAQDLKQVTGLLGGVCGEAANEKIALIAVCLKEKFLISREPFSNCADVILGVKLSHQSGAKLKIYQILQQNVA